MRMLKKLGKLLGFFIVIALFCYLGIQLYVKLSPKVVINTTNSVFLYDKNEEVFFQGNNEKEWVSLDDISPYVIDATIYTEDKNFYKHHGFDYLRILKAFYVNLTSGSTQQGASTITQQYAKNLFLTFDKTWKRKWDEMWYTIKIESTYSKDEILEGYLNTINYGHGMYGIENASNYYFGKSAKDLDLAEATMLTGIPKSPSNFSPLVNLEAAKERQLLILNLLVENGIITEKEKEDAYQKKLQFLGEKERNELTTVMYYHDAVMDELESIDSIPKSYSDTSGLKIYTNLDLDLQKKVEENIKESIPEESEIQTSVVLMEPNTGGVLALVGGKDYDESSFNRATDSLRQVGSTMKPYLYYAALENGFTSSSSFTSEETTFVFNDQEDYTPQNYNKTYGNKPISMGTAIAYSENIYAVKTHLFLGGDSLINVARRVGITAKLENVPSLPLGTNEINILEMAAGYSAFANLGNKVTPHFIERVEDSDGTVLYEAKNSKEAVLNPSITFILNNLLTATYDSDYIDYNYPTAIGLAPKLTHKYALKSGTTETDNWDIGFNNNIVCAVWVGYDDNQSLKTSEYKYAQDIWYKSIEYYERNIPAGDEWYEMPKNVSAVLVEPISGRLVTDQDKKKKMMYFIKGTEPVSTEQEVFDSKVENVKPA